MKEIANKVLKYKKTVLIIFSLAIIFSAVAAPSVGINYNLVDYLPQDSHSTISINAMEDIFTENPPNTRIMIEDITIVEALEYKEELAQVEGVKSINWLDDIVNVYEPLETIDDGIVNEWYKDDTALFTLLIDTGEGLAQTVEDLEYIVGDRGALSGESITQNYTQEATSSEMQTIMMYLIPIIIVVLIISTSSWFEPVLFLITVGIAILINMGTNIFIGEISFITQASGAILQLAVSMDYAIFLLHKFADFREEGMNVADAMKNAMSKSFKSIGASGLTTIFGFLALTLMRFELGADLGIVLAKGIVFSLLSVMFLLPVLTVYTYKIIDKTKHRSFMPKFDKFSKFALKIGPLVMVLVLLIVVPSYKAQESNSFNYGASAMESGEGTELAMNTDKINDTFGRSNQLVLIIPSDTPHYEEEIGEKLYDIEGVSSVISYSKAIGNEIPQSFIPQDLISDLVSSGYSRMIITMSSSEESEISFSAVESIRNLCSAYFGDDYYLAGGTPSSYDIRETVISDNVITTLGSIIAIGLVIMFTYKSLSLPVILIIAIQSSIWINLAVPYFQGLTMAYIGFMIISSVQLGATVDYAILVASSYLENRKLFKKKEAILNTLNSSTGTVLTSSTVLSLSGFVLGYISSNPIIAQLGILLGRGAILSAISVLFFLPTILIIFDKIIAKTTIKSNFYEGENINEIQCIQ